MEEALEESEQKYRLLYTAMDQGLALHEIILDAEGKPVNYRFLDVNESYCRLVGVTRKMTIGRTVKEIMPKVEQYWIDAFGHAVGDELLKKVAEAMQEGCRAGDIISRIGGDEFVIILPNTDNIEAEQV